MLVILFGIMTCSILVAPSKADAAILLTAKSL